MKFIREMKVDEMTELDSSKIKELAGEASTFELFIQYLKDDLEIEYDALGLDEQAIIDEIWYKIPRVYERTEDNLPHTEEWYKGMKKRHERDLLRRQSPFSVLYKCPICGIIKYCYPSEMPPNLIKTCSHRCSAIFTSKYRIKQKDTDIEIIIEEWLQEQNIEYEKQYTQPIGRTHTRVDFFIPPNICLYVDGNYWHRLFKTRRKDKKQNRLLSELGFRVIRIRGSDVRAGKRPVEILTILREKHAKP